MRMVQGISTTQVQFQSLTVKALQLNLLMFWSDNDRQFRSGKTILTLIYC
jgi:hypothetical protein